MFTVCSENRFDTKYRLRSKMNRMVDRRFRTDNDVNVLDEVNRKSRLWLYRNVASTGHAVEKITRICV